jgi:DNA ligase-associated metallophosphoesterase
VRSEQPVRHPSGKAGRSPEGVISRGAGAVSIRFAGLAVTLDASGAAFLPEHGALIVSDLHLEKGSSGAARGRLLPAFDSHDTLQRLRAIIETYKPPRVICLGDSFHDGRAGERMARADRAALSSLCELVHEWIWIGGNHDPEKPEFCEGAACEELRIGGAIFRHEPRLFRDAPEIAGHFHPKASVSAGCTRLSGRCFCVSHDLLIMPAFGAYAGGLSTAHKSLRSLHREAPKLFMLHSAMIWRIA